MDDASDDIMNLTNDLLRLDFRTACRGAVRLSLAIAAVGAALASAAEVPMNSGHLKWNSRIVLEGGRIDAVAWLGEGVIVAGSRLPNPGRVFRSTDLGSTWHESVLDSASTERGPEITCITSDQSQNSYILTSESHVWKSTDRGATWRDLGMIPKVEGDYSAVHSYGLIVLRSGTLLASDTNHAGGHIHRSTDGGEHWGDCGAISSAGLYRLEQTRNGVLVNGWAGRVYQSLDDGRTWSDCGRLSTKPLYATVALDSGIVLQASEAGEVFRSTDEGRTWVQTAAIGDPADDFVDLGKGAVLLSTYLGKKELYLSRDAGLTWTTVGPIRTTVADDVLDHVIHADDNTDRWAIGTSVGGGIVRFHLQD